MPLCDCSDCMSGGRTEPKDIPDSTWYRHATKRRKKVSITSYTTFLAQQPQYQSASTTSDPTSPATSGGPSVSQGQQLDSSRPPPSKRIRLDDGPSAALEVEEDWEDNGGERCLESEGAAHLEGQEGVLEPVEGTAVIRSPVGQDDVDENLSDIYMPLDVPLVSTEVQENAEHLNLEISAQEPAQVIEPEQEDDGNDDRGQRSGHQPELEDFNEVEATLAELKISQQFIEAIRGASLDKDKLPAEVIERLRHPIEELLNLDDNESLRTGIELYLDTTTASEEVYNSVRNTFDRSMKRKGHEFEPIPTLYQVKERIKELTGVYSILHDMCIKSCVAYTGPFSSLDSCPKCKEPRYDPRVLEASNGKKKVPRRQFHTIPPGPQLQALYRSPERAKQMQYRRVKTREVLDQIKASGGFLTKWTDIIHGSDYLGAVSDGKIQEHDILLMMSIDGAQLYQSKQSDCWIYIWIVFELGPDSRYLKEFVLPGGFIGGPDKFQNGDSFLLPGFHHLAALMKEGLAIWDAADKKVFQSKPFLILGAADGPGLTYLNGLTGHSGAYGCRLYCPVKGRRKEGGNHYYPALLKPDNYTVEGCDHDDVDGQHLPIGNTTEYQQALNIVLSSRTATQHQQNRKKTGITKPSIFSAFPPDRVLPVPRCFGGDLMHLIALNLTDLLLALWRGTMDCDPRDDKHTWDWVILIGTVWKRHGARVASTRKHLPGSFDRPPRNPAEKISSGYKAWEFLTYIFGLGPGLFYQLLPDKYWRNFCKLVAAVRILHQRSITAPQLQHAHQLVVEFVKEFEELYYQRKESRLHFCRQSIHALLHLAPEVARLGPGVSYTQWTMERTIGNLGEEIRQPSNPFQNLSERGVRRACLNSLISMLPDLAPKKAPSASSQALGGGYTISMPDRSLQDLNDGEMTAIRDFFGHQGIPLEASWTTKIKKWARLQLPNGQFIRTAWKEKGFSPNEIRAARNIMFHRDQPTRMPEFAEVQFFFRVMIQDTEQTVALISKYSSPDEGLLNESSGALLVCRYSGTTSLEVISVNNITSCVAMVPFKEPEDGRFFVCEKMGLEVAFLGGARGEEDST